MDESESGLPAREERTLGEAGDEDRELEIFLLTAEELEAMGRVYWHFPLES